MKTKTKRLFHLRVAKTTFCKIQIGGKLELKCEKQVSALTNFICKNTSFIVFLLRMLAYGTHMSFFM